ncbi:hypothetical protein A9G34_00955 [Gilliamella sp. Choc4-2]|uniref:ASCH domain-containing protein n=1 Tax=Gilliamella sp. Choc4-2 TaxID=3120237 RepID=UPI00080D9009|nr:ASCH domain-containing protein [Gilliamella apicola]OCG45699.1 hypothetical protein A9G34_00955 [Gilliamella apicola]
MTNAFFPLKKEYFKMFMNGDKNIEYRYFGKRWNFKTLSVGKTAILANGYLFPRIEAKIVKLEIIKWNDAPSYVKLALPIEVDLIAIHLEFKSPRSCISVSTV